MGARLAARASDVRDIYIIHRFCNTWNRKNCVCPSICIGLWNMHDHKDANIHGKVFFFKIVFLLEVIIKVQLFCRLTSFSKPNPGRIGGGKGPIFSPITIISAVAKTPIFEAELMSLCASTAKPARKILYGFNYLYSTDLLCVI